MAIDWKAEAAAAQAGIAEAGAPAKLRRAGDSYDPDTDTVTEGGDTFVSCHAVLADQTITDDNGRRVQATIATLNRQPKTGDTLEVAGLSYQVIKTLTIAPGGVPLLWSAVLET